MSRMQPHTLRTPDWPSPNTASITLTLAVRIVRRFGDRIPSADELVREFDVHKATAYRWRAALRDA